MTASVIEPGALEDLVRALRDRGFRVIGPRLRDGAIVFDELASARELPAGWTDEQDGGTYRLRRRDDEALFGYAVGPHSWKNVLFPSSLRLWRGRRSPDGAVEIEEEPPDETRYALFGARSCDLHAIAIQDRVLVEGRHRDADYAARRERIFVVAVNCGTAGGTCFCVSMGTGPKADLGFDLALTELLDGDHRFLVETGSDRGAEVLAELERREATEADLRAAESVVARTAASMGRELETDGIRDLLVRNAGHPRWEEVAERCLTCGNCTMVCPTCFCTTLEDVTDLAATATERRRVLDSCFSLEYSYLHGGSVRTSGRSRYRQWMTHKLATWWDQFDTSGCVGCGRCITWCPVGIDITEEAAAIRAADGEAGEDAR
jgi:ferredoxin